MKIYFGERKEADMGSDYICDCFEFEGKYYDYYFELDSDHIRIFDTCDRYWVMGMDDYADFQKAMAIVDHYTAPIARAQPALRIIESEEVRAV